MKTRTVTFGGQFYLVDETEASYIVRAFELLGIAPLDTALTLLSLETGKSEIVLSGAMDVAKAMQSGEYLSWTRWQKVA